MKKSSPLMADVARTAGVSVAAVSIALSGRGSSTRVSEATRLKIRKAALRLGYRPDIRGRSLRQRKSFVVAFLCRDTYMPYAVPLLRGVQKACEQREYSVLTFSLGDSAAEERRHIEMALDRRVDGIILTPALDPDGTTNRDLLLARLNEGFPVVQLHVNTCPGVPFAIPNNRAAGALLTRHLIELGHTRIVHLTHEHYRDDELPGFYEDPAREAEGYEAEMQAAGLSAEIVMHRGLPEDPEFDAAMSETTDALLARDAAPTAVAVVSELQTQVLMRCLYRRGIRVPDNLSVATSSDTAATALCAPSLTAARWPLAAEGGAASDMIFRMLDGNPVEDVTLEPELIVRESTAPPGRSSVT